MTAPPGDAELADVALSDFATLRRLIHARPELGFEERLTSDLVAAKLTEWGIAVDRSMAGTAVIGIVHGRDGAASGSGRRRAIGLRADMDALPIQEHNRFAHASRHVGVMHACGHDGHTAMLLAAAHQLRAHRHFDGTVYLIFQPAEEGRGGALAMIDDGLFERYPMEAVFGLHNWPGYAVGSLAVSPGPVMASANTFKLVVHGQGSHAALPHDGVDPVPAACQVVLAWQTIVSRNCRPLDAAVVSATMIHAGEAGNVTPDTCVVEGTVRTFRTEVLDLVEARMAAIAQQTCLAHGAVAEFAFNRRAPALVNHRHESLFAARVAASLFGAGRTLPQEPAMASEDFAFMLQVQAGCYAFIGNGDGLHRESGHGLGPCTLHNPSYDFNDALIPLGARYWVALCEAWLGDAAASGVTA